MSNHGAVGGKWGTSDKSRARRAQAAQDSHGERAASLVRNARVHEGRGNAHAATDAWAEAALAMVQAFLPQPSPHELFLRRQEHLRNGR